MADWTAPDAVWPSPQIEASRIAIAMSSMSVLRSSDSEPRSRHLDEHLVLADHADSAGHALTARFVLEELGDPQRRAP